MEKEKIDALLNKEWYIQGVNAVPVYIVAGPFSGIYTCKKTLGYNYSSFVLQFEKDYCNLHYSMEDFKHVYIEFEKRYKKDRKYVDWLLETSEKEKKPFFDYIEKELGNLSKLDDEALVAEYKKVVDLFYSCFGASHLVEAIALSTDVMIKEALLRDLKKRDLVEKLACYFTVLTLPTKPFFFSEFNKSLIGILEAVRKDKGLTGLFVKKPAEIEKEIQNSPELLELVDRHLKQFFWIRSTWSIGREYSRLDLVKEVKEALEKNEKIEVTTAEKLKENLEKKQQLFKGLGLSQDLKDLVEITDFVSFWQDDRKIVMLSGCWALEKFISEIAKRFGFKPENLKYLLADEISAGSLRDMQEKELEERRAGSLYIYYFNERAILVGKEYLEIKKKLDEKVKHKEVSELDGLCASTGKVVGKARVCLNEKEAEKLGPGDVLVTTMTRPEFVPAMKRAIAVVTDEGGITCHAAIISRELGVPCIVGTKIATKALHDNDLIEVNANHGVLKILRRHDE